jgi:6-phosphofructokinase 1
MTFVHAPKTIDNDLQENDHTPGFISAGAFVAGAFLSIDLDCRASMSASSWAAMLDS